MYHHYQSSYNPYAASDLPQYATQYNNWPEQPSQQDTSMTLGSFSGSFHPNPSSQYHQYPQYQQQYQQYPAQNQQYNPQPQHPTPTPHIQKRTSAQQRWDDYIASEECSDTLQGEQAENQVYVNQVTSELEQRAIADERLGDLTQQVCVDTQHAQQAERDRRLRWAQEMIIQNPALCAEVYFAMTKHPAPARRESSSSSSNSNSSINSGNSSYRGSPA